MDLRLPSPRLISTIAVGSLVAAMLYASSLYGYPLFHSLVEVFAAVVALGLFVVVWNTRRIVDHGFMLMTGVAYLFVGIIGVLHMLAYKGIGLFPGFGSNLPTQLWVVERYLHATTLLIAPLLVGYRLPARRLLAGYGVVAGALVLSVFAGVFPDCYVEGVGLTTFKIVSEYVVIALYLGAIGTLLLRRDSFDPAVLRLLVASVAVFVVTEVAFTLYSDPFGPANRVGHLAMALSYYLAYKATVETALTQPMAVLFRDLAQREHALVHSEGLLRTTLQNAPVGIAEIDAEGNWLSVNPRMCEILGFNAEQLKRMTLQDVVYIEDLRGHVQAMKQVETERRSRLTIEERLCRKDGTLVWTSLTLSPLHHADGAPNGWVLAVEDISVRRQAEARLKRAKELGDALNEIDAAVNSVLDFDEIMNRVVVEASRAVRGHTTIVSLKEESGWRVAYVHGLRTDMLGMRFDTTEFRHVGIVDTTRRVLVANDAANDPRVNPLIAKRYEFRSLLSVPLEVRGETRGILTFYRDSEPLDFSEEEVDFAEKLGASVSLALENARLYAAQRDIADTLQTALLRVPTRVPGLVVGHLYQAASELAKIGGDFYDVFELDDHRVAIVLGDVSGKGLEAATITAIVKSTVRAFAYRDPDPAYVLRETNEAMVRQLDDSHFITATYGVIDTRTGSVVLGSAGHPDPVVCRTTEAWSSQAPRNLPLGVALGCEFETFTERLRVGDSLVLFSDGLTEARGQLGFFGEEGVRGALAKVASMAPSHQAEWLLRTASEHARGQLADDVAIVCVRYEGLPPEITLEPPSAGSAQLN